MIDKEKYIENNIRNVERQYTEHFIIKNNNVYEMSFIDLLKNKTIDIDILEDGFYNVTHNKDIEIIKPKKAKLLSLDNLTLDRLYINSENGILYTYNNAEFKDFDYFYFNELYFNNKSISLKIDKNKILFYYPESKVIKVFLNKNNIIDFNNIIEKYIIYNDGYYFIDYINKSASYYIISEYKIVENSFKLFQNMENKIGLSILNTCPTNIRRKTRYTGEYSYRTNYINIIKYNNFGIVESFKDKDGNELCHINNKKSLPLSNSKIHPLLFDPFLTNICGNNFDFWVNVEYYIIPSQDGDIIEITRDIYKVSEKFKKKLLENPKDIVLLFSKEGV